MGLAKAPVHQGMSTAPRNAVLSRKRSSENLRGPSKGHDIRATPRVKVFIEKGKRRGKEEGEEEALTCLGEFIIQSGSLTSMNKENG